MPLEIPKTNELEERVFGIANEKDFATIALEVYHYQFDNNPIYQDYCNALSRTPENVGQLTDVPFLPIGFFKTHRVETTSFDPALVFRSSGTTGGSSSVHYIKDARLYEKSFLTAFESYFGKAEEFCIIGLLPSYIERGGSSLVYMVDHLIRKTGKEASGFYLHDFERLNQTLATLESSGQKTLLIGVTYALLDFAARFPQTLGHTTVMETGGMKGRSRELTRDELYDQLKSRLGVAEIFSEYGMTELLSQAYAIDGVFQSPPWMNILIRDETDPFNIYRPAARPQTGAINVIDLANLYSCSFLATEDLGKLYPGGKFEVLGRMDNSDIRGCSLMSAQMS